MCAYSPSPYYVNNYLLLLFRSGTLAGSADGSLRFTTWRKLITECAILAILSFSVLFVYWNGNIPIIIIIYILVC